MESSGFGKVNGSTSSTIASFLTDEDERLSSLLDLELNNKLLLLVLIGISGLLLFLLLLCFVVYICNNKHTRKRKRLKGPFKTHTILLSKCTSVSGLNENYSEFKVQNKKQLAVEILKNDLKCDASQLVECPTSNFSRPRLTADERQTFDPGNEDNKIEKDEHIPLHKTDSSKEHCGCESPSSTCKLVSTSLPVDAHGHSKAWFVPFDKVHHEPLRHSFIDVTKQQVCTSNSQDSDYREECRSMVTKKEFLKETSKECFPQKRLATPVDSDVSNIDPLSVSNNCSSTFQDEVNFPASDSTTFEKKPSLWDQLEDRPVVFLHDTEVFATASPGAEKGNMM